MEADTNRLAWLETQLVKCDALLAANKLSAQWHEVVEFLRSEICDELVRMVCPN